MIFVTSQEVTFTTAINAKSVNKSLNIFVWFLYDALEELNGFGGGKNINIKLVCITIKPGLNPKVITPPKQHPIITINISKQSIIQLAS